MTKSLPDLSRAQLSEPGEDAPGSGDAMNGAAAAGDHSLARLLLLVLGLDERLPVYATPSLADWSGSEAGLPWPPPHGPVRALCLIDTRDDAAWSAGSPIHAGSHVDDGALFILTGSGARVSLRRRLLERVRGGARRRRSEPNVREWLASVHPADAVQRLAFNDGPHVPDTFRPGDAPSTGAALVVMNRHLFGDGAWAHVRRQLGDPTAVPGEIHLRARGAAVAIMHTAQGDTVVRIVPPGPLQEVVRRNHVALAELRRRLQGDSRLLQRIPQPLFADTVDGVLLMAETCLAGRLAWTVDRGALRPVLLRNAHDFLDALRAATAVDATVDAGALQRLLQNERAMLERSAFVHADVAAALQGELESAVQLLTGARLRLHASHGDFGYGNILVDPESGSIGGVIDWDTARIEDLPGIDRVNLEIQVLRRHITFSRAVERAWSERLAHEAFLLEDARAQRALFGLALVRYITRAMSYPALYAAAEPEFRRAAHWLVASRS